MSRYDGNGSRYGGSSSDLTIEVYPSGGDNDQIQIQAAIDSLPAYPLGGTISLAAGDFNISESINVRGAMTIEGQGVYATQLNLVANVDMFVHDVTPATGTEGFFRLRQVWCDGRKNQGYTSAGLVCNDKLWDVYVNQCFFGNFGGDAIRTQQGWGWVINDVVIEWCKGNGVVLDAGGLNTTGPKISDCKIIDNMKHGIQYRGGGGGNICNNELSGTLTAFNDETVYAKLNLGKDVSGWTEGDVVRNNSGSGDDWTGEVFDLYTSGRMVNTQAIVSVDTGSYATLDIADGIENVTKSDTTTIAVKAEFRYAGISLEVAGAAVPITSNRIAQLTNSIGIHLQSNNVAIVGNTIYGGHTGIRTEVSTGNFNTITGNMFYNASYLNIDDQGGDNIIYGNGGGASGTHSPLHATQSGALSVTGDGAATTITLNHNLSEQPHWNVYNVEVTPASAKMAAATWWVSSVTSTQIVITFSAVLENLEDYDFYVRASNNVTHNSSGAIIVAT